MRTNHSVYNSTSAKIYPQTENSKSFKTLAEKYCDPNLLVPSYLFEKKQIEVK